MEPRDAAHIIEASRASYMPVADFPYYAGDGWYERGDLWVLVTETKAGELFVQEWSYDPRPAMRVLLELENR
jgi:hypothetical protein